METQDTNFNPKMSSEMDICHGCGNTYRDCVCEELDAEMNEGKYPDCDPNDGYYAAPKYIDEIKLKAKVMKQSSSEPLEEKPKCTLSDYDLIIMATGWVSKLCESGGTKFEMRIPVDYNHDTDMIFTEVIQRFEKANARISSLESDNSYLQTQLDIQKRITDGRDRSICDLEDSLHRLESELKALREENERLKHWHNEKDEEADAERVSLAVAEIESEIQQATKEQENKFLSLLAENEALREERDQNKRLLTILVNQINALREERDKLINFIKTPFDCPECGEKIAYGITDELKALFERFKPIP